MFCRDSLARRPGHMNDQRSDRLEGKAVVVTGVATGIGEALARLLVAGGSRVALVDLDPAVATLDADLGPDLIADVADVRDSSVAPADSAGVVVNGTALTTTDEDWDLAMAVNVTGTDVVVDGGALAAFEPPGPAFV